MTTKEKEEKKENFQEWLFVMDDNLEELKSIFKKDENIELDFHRIL